jgi:hypothetical protein
MATPRTAQGTNSLSRAVGRDLARSDSVGGADFRTLLIRQYLTKLNFSFFQSCPHNHTSWCHLLQFRTVYSNTRYRTVRCRGQHFFAQYQDRLTTLASRYASESSLRRLQSYSAFCFVTLIIPSPFAAPSQPAPPPFISSHQKLQYNRYPNGSDHSWAVDSSDSWIPDEEVHLKYGSQISVLFTGYFTAILFKPKIHPNNHRSSPFLK